MTKVGILLTKKSCQIFKKIFIQNRFWQIIEKISLYLCAKNWPYRRSGLRPIFRTNSVSAKNSNSLKNVFIKLQMFWLIQWVYILHLLKVLTTTIHLQKKKTTKKLCCYGEKTVKNNGFSPFEEKRQTKPSFIMSSTCLTQIYIVCVCFGNTKRAKIGKKSSVKRFCCCYAP